MLSNIIFIDEKETIGNVGALQKDRAFIKGNR